MWSNTVCRSFVISVYFLYTLDKVGSAISKSDCYTSSQVLIFGALRGDILMACEKRLGALPGCDNYTNCVNCTISPKNRKHYDHTLNNY